MQRAIYLILLFLPVIASAAPPSSYSGMHAACDLGIDPFINVNQLRPVPGKQNTYRLATDDGISPLFGRDNAAGDRLQLTLAGDQRVMDTRFLRNPPPHFRSASWVFPSGRGTASFYRGELRFFVPPTGEELGIPNLARPSDVGIDLTTYRPNIYPTTSRFSNLRPVAGGVTTAMGLAAFHGAMMRQAEDTSPEFVSVANRMVELAGGDFGSANAMCEGLNRDEARTERELNEYAHTFDAIVADGGEVGDYGMRKRVAIEESLMQLERMRGTVPSNIPQNLIPKYIGWREGNYPHMPKELIPYLGARAYYLGQ